MISKNNRFLAAPRPPFTILIPSPAKHNAVPLLSSAPLPYVDGLMGRWVAP